MARRIRLYAPTVFEGLACGIWSRDYKAALRLGQALQTGTVWVNTYKVFSISTSLGGSRHSGLGRGKGRALLAEYMLQKSYYWGLNTSPLSWTQAPQEGAT